MTTSDEIVNTPDDKSKPARPPRSDIRFAWIVHGIFAYCWLVVFAGGAGFALCGFNILPLILMFYISLVLLIPSFLLYRCVVRIQNKKQRFIHALLIILLPILSISLFNPLTCGINFTVYRTGGLESLQQWALSMIDKPAQELTDPERYKPENRLFSIKADLYNNQIKRIGNSVWILKDTAPAQAISDDGIYVRIPTGGYGFLASWGVYFTHPSNSLPPEIPGKKISDGIYRYYSTSP